MPKIHYRSGDVVVLKDRVLGRTQPGVSGRIVSVLPETQGGVRYRVRFQHESFERNIAQDEIDAASSPSHAQDAQGASSRGAKSSWINPNAIRIRK